MMRRTKSAVSYLRNFVFGVEDSLVSTVGLLSGIAVGGVERETIFLTGIVLIFVEAFSMSAGSFLSESSAETFSEKKTVFSKSPYYSAVIMFISYFASGFIPLAPYLIFTTPLATWVSIGLSLVALGVLGLVSGILTKGVLWQSVLRMSVVGGVAIGVGVVAGMLVG